MQTAEYLLDSSGLASGRFLSWFCVMVTLPFAREWKKFRVNLDGTFLICSHFAQQPWHEAGPN